MTSHCKSAGQYKAIHPPRCKTNKGETPCDVCALKWARSDKNPANLLPRAIAQLRASEKVIAAERDKLRDIHGEIEQQFEDADTACADLASAIEKLSELV